MPQNHVRSTTLAIQLSLIGAVTLFGVSTAEAAGAVTIRSWDGLDNSLDTTSTMITAVSASVNGISNNSMTDNPGLNFSAWGHTGRWYNFENQLGGSNVKVTVTGEGGFVPGVGVWATGASEFDAGTTDFGSEVSSASFGTPHSFNVSGKQGDPGTLWMANGFGGNVLETLGYAVANPNVDYGPANTGWGETIKSGWHDVSLTNTFESGINGSTRAQEVQLSFNNLAAGWYTVYIGGTDSNATNGEFGLSVMAIPEAETWAMLLAGLGVIGWRLRKQSGAASGMMLA